MIGDPDKLTEAEAIELLQLLLQHAREGHGDWQTPARAPAGISFPANATPWSSARFLQWEVHIRHGAGTGRTDVCLRQCDGRRWYAASTSHEVEGALERCVCELLDHHDATVGEAGAFWSRQL
jgi:hypothetical protein